MEQTRPEFTRVALVVNCASRTGAAAYERVRERLSDLGIRVDTCYPLIDATRLAEAVEDVATDHDLVVVGGGDGTLSTAVDHLANRDVTMGVIPLGTANDFARTLEIPTDLDAACETIAGGKVVDIDLGVAGSSFFVNVASIGLSVAVARALAPVLKRRLGPLAYPAATLRAYRSHRPFTAWLDFPDDDHAAVRLDDLLQLAVGNGRHYGGGNAISPTAGIDDHTLDLYAVPRGRLREHVSFARLLRDGSLVEHERVFHVTTRRVRVRTEPAQPVNVDGEVVTSTPVDFGVERNALDILVPQTSTAARMDPDTSEHRPGGVP